MDFSVFCIPRSVIFQLLSLCTLWHHYVNLNGVELVILFFCQKFSVIVPYFHVQ